MGNQTIIDLFAGPGGWDEGLRMIGRRDVLGIEWDKSACLTAEAAGHKRLRADVAALDPAAVLPPVGAVIEGLIASAPCTKFSGAGSGVGVKVLGVLADAIRRIFSGEDCREEVREAVYPTCLRDRESVNRRRPPSRRWTSEQVESAAREDAFVTCLVLEPARWIVGMNPEWVALEQVPQVQPLWDVYAACLRARGFSAWTGVLCAADYGVPQTRTRAILMASRVRTVTPPEPTHSEHPEGVDLFGGGHREKWVSMAEALGWAPGLDVNTRGNRRTSGGNEFTADRPSWALTGKTRSWFVSAGVTGQGRPKNPETQPADTITGKGTAYWQERPASTIATNQRTSTTGDYYERSVSEPAPTVTGNVDRWLRGSNQANAAIRGPHEPAPTARIADPGHKNRANGERQFRPDGVRVTVQEAGILQSFTADYPWQGSRTKQYEAVGNAVPPRVAAHVLAAVMGGPHDYIARIGSYYHTVRAIETKKGA